MLIKAAIILFLVVPAVVFALVGLVLAMMMMHIDKEEANHEETSGHAVHA